jgi:3-isopropylmalate/(R)-2-methylmalate dehydratase small subunit
MVAEIKGKALKYGDNINTDIISPPQYMELPLEDASKFAMSAIDPGFTKRVRRGDIFVAEKNLGSGSSRETAPLTLKALGIGAVVAESFARIFYRNLINVGIPAIVCAQTFQMCDGDELSIDIGRGIICDLTLNERFACDVLPEHIYAIINDGGLFNFLEKWIKERAKQ